MPENGDKSSEDWLAEIKDAVGDINDSDVPTSKKVNKAAVQENEGTFPTEMNCSQVFDQLLKCYSLGGQIRHYYRYGEMSYCIDKRDKMKFCLSTKLKGEAAAKLAIKQWYMKSQAEQQVNLHTSEAVWNSRPEPLRRPFREDAELYIKEDEN